MVDLEVKANMVDICVLNIASHFVAAAYTFQMNIGSINVYAYYVSVCVLAKDMLKHTDTDIERHRATHVFSRVYCV